jgi:hypothetical protein
VILSSIAYAVLTLNQRPVDYGFPLTVSNLLLPAIFGTFIIGGLVGLFARMGIERREALLFSVFMASVFALLGSLGLFQGFPGPGAHQRLSS